MYCIADIASYTFAVDYKASSIMACIPPLAFMLQLALLSLLMSSRTQCISSLTSAASFSVVHPQYVLVNKMYGCSGDPYCWNQDQPSTCTQASIQEILSALNYTSRSLDATATRRLGVSFQFNVIDTLNQTAMLCFLDNLLELAEVNGLAVGITIDAFEFWSKRPDLWNHFDKSKAGFNASNVQHVEWTSWSPVNATYLAWRNWGSQFRVPPHPNLASPAVLQAYAESMLPMLRKVAGWYSNLPLDRQHLLAYVKPSWEAWIGTNYFFYPNGNALYNSSASSDPSSGLKDAIQLGYNAACTLGLACKGEITTAHLDAILASMLQFVADLATKQAGLPRSKVMTHAGANWGDVVSERNTLFNTGKGGITTAAQPGWSFYSLAYDPSQATSLSTALAEINNTHWGATEWLYLGGNKGTGEQQWFQALSNTLNYRNNRLVDIFNWEGIRGNPDATQALVALLQEAPGCFVDAPTNLTTSEVNSTAVLLSWNPPFLSEAAEATSSLTLSVTTHPALDTSGQFANITLLRTLVTHQTHHLLQFDEAEPGQTPTTIPTLYWSLSVTGCESQQQMITQGPSFQRG
eukprot:m.26129 g.26129  ORF g.26129 m.26129 type:complete len:578 (-) comp9979_c0_seq1:44-1777(-)